MSFELDDLHENLANANLIIFGVERDPDGRPTGRSPNAGLIPQAERYRAHCHNVLTLEPTKPAPSPVAKD